MNFSSFFTNAMSNNTPQPAPSDEYIKQINEAIRQGQQQSLPKMRELLQNLLVVEDTYEMNGEPVPAQITSKIATIKTLITMFE